MHTFNYKFKKINNCSSFFVFHQMSLELFLFRKQFVKMRNITESRFIGTIQNISVHDHPENNRLSAVLKSLALLPNTKFPILLGGSPNKFSRAVC